MYIEPMPSSLKSSQTTAHRNYQLFCFLTTGDATTVTPQPIRTTLYCTAKAFYELPFLLEPYQELASFLLPNNLCRLPYDLYNKYL